jgi:hypothetical protein
MQITRSNKALGARGLALCVLREGRREKKTEYQP